MKEKDDFGRKMMDFLEGKDEDGILTEIREQLFYCSVCDDNTLPDICLTCRQLFCKTHMAKYHNGHVFVSSITTFTEKMLKIGISAITRQTDAYNCLMSQLDDPEIP